MKIIPIPPSEQSKIKKYNNILKHLRLAKTCKNLDEMNKHLLLANKLIKKYDEQNVKQVEK